MDSVSMFSFGVMWYAVFLFSLTCHEAAHAFAAWRLGDRTAYEGGQVTLNPLPHMVREPFGTILVPLASFLLTHGSFMMGWASAPYDPYWASRYPRRAAWMAAAGPAANLLLVLLAALVIRVGLGAGTLEAPAEGWGFSQIVAAADAETFWGPLARLLSIAFMLNLVLFAFNLLPLPPLDGSAMLPLVVGERLARSYSDFIREPPWPMVGLFAAWYLFGYVFEPIATLALALLYLGS